MFKTILKRIFLVLFFMFLAETQAIFAEEQNGKQEVSQKPTYTILVSEETKTDAQWGKVVTALEAKHAEKYDVSVITWNPQKPAEILEELRKSTHRYVCFVAKPTEAGARFVMITHVLMRSLDDDPYTDAFWAILTGHEAADALRIIATPDTPVCSVVAGTDVAFDLFESGVGYDEGAKNLKRTKIPGEKVIISHDAPDDTTHAIADALNSADLFVTSGHATEGDWQIGYSYRNGQFLAKDGQLFGKTTDGEIFPIQSQRPKSHLASGNCLIGHIKTDGCMAPSLVHSAGVNMLVGYVVPTWFGYMGWGVQDYFIEQPGRFTLCEAFFANNQALVHRLLNADTLKLGEMDKQGLKFDMNVVAIYGDPAWQNALVEKPSGWEQKLTSSMETDENGAEKTVWTLEITPLRGEKTFDLLCSNGSQRGGRPIIAFLPYIPTAHELPPATILEGEEYQPVVTENFILVPISGMSKTEKTLIRFHY
ncbi:MAG: hypothetical protein Q4C70_13080 [Planctomycetia bacterium]|nr:hypothetical protein [Planctomycetia bacterium]